MDLGDVRNGWPAKITLAYDDGADGLEIVQSGREPAGVVRNANEEWSLDGWMDRGRGGDCQMQELYHLPLSPFPYSPTLSLICLSLACFIGRQQQLLPDQGLLLGRSIVSLTRGQYNSPLSLSSLCAPSPRSLLFTTLMRDCFLQRTLPSTFHERWEVESRRSPGEIIERPEMIHVLAVHTHQVIRPEDGYGHTVPCWPYCLRTCYYRFHSLLYII